MRINLDGEITFDGLFILLYRSKGPFDRGTTGQEILNDGERLMALLDKGNRMIVRVYTDQFEEDYRFIDWSNANNWHHAYADTITEVDRFTQEKFGVTGLEVNISCPYGIRF